MTLLEKLIEYSEKGGFTPSYHDETNELVFTEFVERYAYHFWEDNGVWYYGRSGANGNRSTELSTPDYDIALRWLIYHVAGDARYRMRFHPLAIPVYGGIKTQDISQGWGWEFVRDGVGTLITPNGQHLPIEIYGDQYICPIDLVVLSHLMAYTPEQLLTSYMDPYGRPHLTHYLHEDPALVRMGNPLPTPIPPLETAN